MKKSLLLLSIIATLSCVCEVFAQKPVYIYRNEGYISSFITEEIDSITYSRMDADSIMQSEYCMTEIHACDTTYRIPIASIDSISFVTPSTILKPGVFSIDEHLLTWVSGYDDLDIKLKASTPGNLLPKVGDTVVSVSESDSPLNGLFLGKVSEMTTEGDGITIKCTPVSFADGFERYYGSFIADGSAGNVPSRATDVPPGWGTWTPEPYKKDLLEDFASEEYKPIEDLAIDFKGSEMSFTVAPSFKYYGRVISNPPYETSIALSIIGDYRLTEKLSLGCNMEYDHDIELIDKSVKCGYVEIFFELGVYCRADVHVALDKEWDQYFRSVFHWEWAKDKEATVSPVNKFFHVRNEESGNYAIDGSLSTGFYAKIGPRFPKILDFDIAEINLRAEAGIGLKGEFIPLKTDTEDAKTSTEFYNKIKNEKIEAFCEFGLQGEAKLFGWSATTPPDLGSIPMKPQLTLNSVSTVPSFSNIGLTRNNDNSISVKADAKGYVGGNDLGFALSKDGKFAEEDYVYKWNNYKGPDASFNHVYSGKSPDGDYQVYPLIKWMGIEMIADVNGCNNDLHPHNVDLGLPSGTKWCCVNIGASNPTDFGEYYEGSTDKDIATEIMGAGYMTPTKKQFQELLDNTEQIRSTINGVDGFIFKAKNGNSIFLPAAAQLWMDDETSSWEINNKGTGAYWTKTRSDGNYIYFIEFNDEESKPFFGDRHQKNNRLTIRPIYVEP